MTNFVTTDDSGLLTPELKDILKPQLGGSGLSVSVRGFGAVGNGQTDDTDAVLAALDAAGPYGYVDFEAGTYLVKESLGLDFWGARIDGPGVITDGSTQYRVSPRSYADTNYIWVDGKGDDQNDGLSPDRPIKSLSRLGSIFERMGDQMARGFWTIRLSGDIVGGKTFSYLPTHRLYVTFEGDPLSGGEPTTLIKSAGPNDGFGLRFEAGQLMRVGVKNLGIQGFSGGARYGFIMKSGGFANTENLFTQDCAIGSAYIGNGGFSEKDSRHRGYTISGTRAQYNESGSWLRADASGGGSEGFHISRNAVTHVDICTATDNSRDGVWIDMNSRVSVTGSTIQRNAREGVRGEGGAEVHIDDQTNGPNNFGVNTANANGVRGVGLHGMARLTATESIYGITDKMIDSWRGSTSSARTAARGLAPYRIGEGARLTSRIWGLNSGSVQIKLSDGASYNTALGTIQIPASMASGWLIDFSVEIAKVGSSLRWVGYASLNGGPTIMISAIPAEVENRVQIVPSGGVAVRGSEHYTGG